ncbi:hypothetical protein [Psychrobium sp. 1_MG-2023]|uniref:hypothetical protein n=1 Tax=Psychrobium sp. 1_MG-2023 TaxID=3062624 RepID=UPI001292A269|nr:hypothetical protein [Psychrobium sp. 1_MG-2023]MDP2562855.1 hypothetical protein [Psychrobium sp. 1_MG-2023]
MKSKIWLIAILINSLGLTHAVMAQPTNKQSSKVEIAKESVITIETTIVGTKEKPTFLSIVPWRVLPDARHGVVELRRQLQQQLTPIEPNELRNQLKLQSKLGQKERLPSE